MRLCGSDAFRLYSSEDSERGVETGTLCTDRCPDVYGQLQRRGKRSGNCTWNRAGTLLRKGGD